MKDKYIEETDLHRQLRLQNIFLNHLHPNDLRTRPQDGRLSPSGISTCTPRCHQNPLRRFNQNGFHEATAIVSDIDTLLEKEDVRYPSSGQANAGL
ncbi:hypothetical protein N7450_001948 [Penicillium hetheringtonii]|uniref:Uncharacterized protein n=1 Tax=Penicillium hetheringtonii TaxID=911720 RepID=A0AAD6E5J5_9EURO|nr:hypothetical protein N7450_001948 [Penicillium hetheringtonii]